MKQKNILIIIVIAILLAVAGTIVTYIYMNNNDIEYTSLNLSDTCAVSVPVSNNSTFTDDDGIKTYFVL